MGAADTLRHRLGALGGVIGPDRQKGYSHAGKLCMEGYLHALRGSLCEHTMIQACTMQSVQQMGYDALQKHPVKYVWRAICMPLLCEHTMIHVHSMACHVKKCFLAQTGSLPQFWPL